MTAERILCVDDDPGALETRRLVLAAAGYSVLAVDSGPKALDLLRSDTPIDVALVDYLMPGMNGEELARKMREERPQLPLVGVSAVNDLPKSFLALLDSHVQKGEDPEILLSTLSFVLAHSKRQDTRDQHTVLCVEDEASQLHMRQLLFESAGFRVLTAESGKAALSIFLSEHVDAVLLDYWLSGGNGTTVAVEMKRLNPQTPIIMLSGYSSLPGEDIVVDLWLRKASVEPEDLTAEVSRLIQSKNKGRTHG
ncbi:MAG TPA: response regulator [Terriglobales bacterium]|nr:response regulator [Terriglobales bacterium]